VRELKLFFSTILAKLLPRAQIIEVASQGGEEPENWHQRLSELRTDQGYTILSNRDGHGLKLGEYLMVNADKRAKAGKRVLPTKPAWAQVLKRAGSACEWDEGGERCALKDGEIDPIGGGTVKLTPDHMTPHSVKFDADPDDPAQWRALCGRHQVMKRNFWDNSTGKLNVYAIVQAASREDKELVFELLRKFFKDSKG